MLIATEFQVLRGVTSCAKTTHAVERKPERVVMLLDEDRFQKMGCGLIHHRTVFFEDEMHDWAWAEGQLRYFGRSNGAVDLLLIYQTGTIRFCPNCGVKQADTGACGDCGTGQIMQ